MLTRVRLCFSQLLALAICSCACAQLTITEPESTKGPIRQVSSTLPISSAAPPWEGIAAARNHSSSGKQIRVSVQYLFVDEETRASIFADLEQDKIKTTSQIPSTADSEDLRSSASPLRSSQQIRSPSRVTTCVLNAEDAAGIMEKAIQSVSSDVVRSPSVMLLDGKQAEMNDIAQRPFVVDVRREGMILKPVAHVIDEGTRLRLLAILSEPSNSTSATDPAIDLSCELQVSRVLDVATEEIFGLAKEPMTTQVPLHQVTSAIASQRLAKGQSLLVDPHVVKSKTIEQESKVPVLGNIPYVGRTFSSTAVGTIDQHMLMLLLPSIEKVAP